MGIPHLNSSFLPSQMHSCSCSYWHPYLCIGRRVGRVRLHNHPRLLSTSFPPHHRCSRMQMNLVPHSMCSKSRCRCHHSSMGVKHIRQYRFHTAHLPSLIHNCMRRLQQSQYKLLRFGKDLTSNHQCLIHNYALRNQIHNRIRMRQRRQRTSHCSCMGWTDTRLSPHCN